jgi:cytochrome c oxidase cbb3-type subunit 1
MTLPHKKLPDLLALLFAAVGLIAGVILIVMAPEGGTKLRGAILVLACVITFGMLAKKDNATGDDVMKAAVIAALVWGIAGFLIGDFIAWQLAFPVLNFDLPWTNFGRLHPLHTSVMIFAFCGNALLASSLYALQRTYGSDLYGRFAAWFVFISYNTFIVIEGANSIMGATGAENAEVEWYVNLWLALVWIVYLFVFFGTIGSRKEPRIHVANWFFAVFIVTVGMLHIVSNVMAPVPFLATKIYTVFPGVQDWWYDFNKLGFFLTAGFLGVMYLFLPARAGRPIYSRKLAIVHCLALCLTYFIWLTSFHLYYTALPDWVQDASMALSFLLWLLFLAGMVNGLTPLADAGSKLITDPVIRFFAVAIAIIMVAVAFYDMPAFTGPLMSIKAVNSLSHYTDWTVGSHHQATLDWGVPMIFGALYCLVPWLWKREALYSKALVEWHFWLSVLGALLYVGSMWVSGIMQGLMLSAHDNNGLLYYQFADTVEAMHPYYIFRAVGGALFSLGALIMAFNLWMTVTAQPAKIEGAGTMP